MKNKLIKKGVVLFLALFLFFCSPVTVHAATNDEIIDKLDTFSNQVYSWFDILERQLSSGTNSVKNVLNSLNDSFISFRDTTFKNFRDVTFVSFRTNVYDKLNSIISSLGNLDTSGIDELKTLITNHQSSFESFRDVTFKNFRDTTFANFKTQVYKGINDIYNPLADYLNTTFPNFKTQVYKGINDIYSYLQSFKTAVLTEVNENESLILQLNDEMKQQSSDIQQNADKNSQNQIDNENKNHDDFMNYGDDQDSYEYDNNINGVLGTIEEYCDNLDETILQIDTASASASEYIQQGTSVIDDVLGVLPGSVLVLITFGIVFIFSRKVVGR